MGNLSAAMVEEFDRSNHEPRYFVQFTFPDGVKHYSDVALCSRVVGVCDPLVLDFGAISDAGGDRANAMQVSDWSGLKIADPDQDWIARGEKFELKGSAVQLVCGYKGMDTADFLTRFDGILLDWQAQDGVITVQCGPSFLLPLLAPFPEIRLTLADFPEMEDESIDIYAPIGPYGRHDSYAFGKAEKGSSDGQLTPLYVGEYTETNLEDDEITGSKYIIGVGRIKRVIMVYDDGVPIIQGFASGNWKDQAIYEEINGVVYSRIMFQSDKSETTITVDLEGYEDVGDGTGELITDPGDQIAHFLSNFVFGRYRRGNWLPTAEQIDTTYLAAILTYLGRQRIPTGYTGARYVEATDERGLGMDELDAWCASHEIKGLFTLQGLLAFGADSADDPGDVSLLPWWKRQVHELTSGVLTPTYPSMGAAKRIIGETSFSHSRGAYTERLMVLSATSTQEAADKLSRPWGPGLI